MYASFIVDLFSYLYIVNRTKTDRDLTFRLEVFQQMAPPTFVPKPNERHPSATQRVGGEPS
jgi:hypothetical protein